MRSLSIRRFEFEEAAFAIEVPSIAAEMLVAAVSVCCDRISESRPCRFAWRVDDHSKYRNSLVQSLLRLALTTYALLSAIAI
jgi:hypothetical protein